jgi:aryl-alcohol dehydrogenase-like predicted oxidoreductase
VRYQRLGASGIEVSVIGLGCNMFGATIDRPQARSIVDAAIESGINFFDTAAVYGAGASEEMLGEAIRGRRDEVVIATKFADTLRRMPEVPPGRADQVVLSVDASLARLGLEFVDLIYYHMPDRVTPIAETVGAMQDLVAAGKARAIAVANFAAPSLREAAQATRASGKEGVVALQNQYSLLERDAEREALPLARELGIGFIPYMPLANGLLTGKYKRGAPAPTGSRLDYFGSLGVGTELLGDDRFDEVDRLTEFAADYGHSLRELAIAAVASTPGVASVLVGASAPEHVRGNASASEWQLDVDTLAAIPRVESLGMNLGFGSAGGR